MDIATTTWFKNLYEFADKKIRLDEVSREGISKTFEFMAKMGDQIQTEFDDLFDGKMRIVVPLLESDTQKIVQIVEVLKADGWKPSGDNDAFLTKHVKQKKERLAAAGGGFQEVEVLVASLDLKKVYDFTIPAGPRKGETIAKTESTSMSKAIAKAVKQKKLDPSLLEWWRKKQTFYATDDDGWETIEQVFNGTLDGDEWRILLSRHPVDVLRMSDIGSISSCHAEFQDYFPCAVEESLGNGLIAYLVKTQELNEFLSGYIPGTPLQQAQRIMVRALNNEKWFDIALKSLNDSEGLGTWINIIKGSAPTKVMPTTETLDLITTDMARDAIRAKLDNKPWPEEDEIPAPRPIGDFDKQEIFRDRDRDIPGISASTRLRLRKFHDTASGDWIAVPEARLYGKPIDRFRTAVREWTWEQQKEIFIDESDPSHLELPRQSYLERYGGSYGDTNDGSLLNAFFSMSGTEITTYSGNVTHIHDEESNNAWQEMETELEEVLNSANNRSDHMGFHAEVGGDDAFGEPYVTGGASVEFSFAIGWKGDYQLGPKLPGVPGGYDWPEEERGYSIIPHAWGGDWTQQRNFTDTLDSALGSDDAAEETDWEVSTTTLPWIQGVALQVTFRFNFDGADAQDFDYWADSLLVDIDGNYDEKYESIRRTLAKEEYIAFNDFDRLIDDIREQSDELKNWEVLGFDIDGDLDADGEIWFNFKPLRPGITPSTQTKLGYLPGILGTTLTALRLVFGSAGELVAGTSYGGKEVRPGVPFMNMLSEKLKPLEDAANGYAEAQLEFDFGEKYNRPTYEGVDFGTAQVRLGMDPRHITEAGLPGLVFFKMKVIIESKTPREEIEGALKFMQFIDRYPEQVIRAVSDTYEAFVQNKLEETKEKERKTLDGTYMNELARRLSLKFADVARARRTGLAVADDPAEQAMFVVTFVQENWDEFSRFEKYAAVDNFLRPLSIGSLRPDGIWNPIDLTPHDWEAMVRARMGEWQVPNAREYTWRGDWKPGPSALALIQNKLGIHGSESVAARNTVESGLGDEERSNAMDALVRGDREEFIRIIRGSVNESLEEQIDRIDRMLTERDPIDLRLYKVAIGCVVDLKVAGYDSQIENQIRGIEEVTTVSHRVDLERRLSADVVYRVYQVKFELYGQQARDTYRDAVLVPAIEREVTGVTVRDRGLPELADSPLREWGGLGYVAPPADRYLPTMPTPAVGLQSVLEDWVEGGVQIYDTPMNTNQMQYHVMMPVSDLWEYCSRYYRGTTTDFEGRYKHFIKSGPQLPVYVALGQNGRVKITGNEDLIWFAKEAGQEELPVFFSYQRQV